MIAIPDTSPVAGARSAAPISPRDVALPREFLTFRLGGEEYGIDILRVQEIRSYEEPTRIANASGYIKGVVNLRGVIVPVVDLRILLGSASVDYSDFTVVVVLNLGGRVIGAVVDSVSDVMALEAQAIKPAPEMDDGGASRHVLGIGCVSQGETDRMLILIDIVALVGGALASSVPSAS